MSRKRALPVNTKYSGEDFDTDYDDDERSNGKNTAPITKINCFRTKKIKIDLNQYIE